MAAGGVREQGEEREKSGLAGDQLLGESLTEGGTHVSRNALLPRFWGEKPEETDEIIPVAAFLLILGKDLVDRLRLE